MDFPDRRAPATGGGTGEAAVIIHVQVHIVDHKLIDNFDLLALQRKTMSAGRDVVRT